MGAATAIFFFARTEAFSNDSGTNRNRLHIDQQACIAQSAERQTEDLKIAGSSPGRVKCQNILFSLDVT